ncbi:MAG TPA: hypothetical protein VNV87_09990 [Acidimicrobiales bacterium]|jgi:hypothetical protein|nr:hypothetical protein [Acidimicrobiales bacterium]
MASHNSRRRWAIHGVATAAYLVAAIAVWSGVWFGHPTSTASCGCGDTSLFTWFMAWPAYALTHAQGLFFTTKLLHPNGINLPANTSVLALSLPLSPVTWLFGPVASLNVAATLAPVASALSARALVRRWTTWEPAAFAAGLVYGFSPFVMESLNLEHVDTATLVVPPLLFLCLYELLVRQRGRAWAWGLALGGLATVQFFISSEVLTMCALSAALGVVVVIAATAVGDGQALRTRWRHAVTGMVTAGVSAGVLLAYPAWYATSGPRSLPQQVFPDIPYFGNRWATLFLPPGPHDRGPNAVLESYGYFGSHPLLMGYLGIGMTVALVVGLILFCRDLRLWFCAVMLVILDALSLGAGHGPWWLFQHVPIVDNVAPERISSIADLFAAAMLGIIMDRAHRSGWTLPGHGRHASVQAPAPSGPSAGLRHRIPGVGTVVAVVLALVAIVPIAWQYDLPLATRSVAVPTWFTTAGTRLPPGQVVLTYPYASSGLQAPMTWQAVAGLRFSLVGGGGITPAPPSHPTPSQRVDAQAAIDLSTLSYGFLPLPTGTPTQLHDLRQALHDWGVTKIVAPSEAGTPASIHGRSIPLAVAYFTAALHQAPIEQLGSWVWPVPPGLVVASMPPTGAVTACAATAQARTNPGAAATCVIDATTLSTEPAPGAGR